MPVYRFRCQKCGKEAERLLPMDDRDLPQECECRGSLRRLMTAPSIIVPETGREQVLGALNKERGYDLPTIPSDRPRMEAALAKGLDQRRPIIGRGF